MKPFSQACINNRDVILNHLHILLLDQQCVLEIGSGTGQHAVYFSQNLPNIQWQTSDLLDNHEGINSWRKETGQPNCLAPIVLDIANPQWPSQQYDAIFTANTFHICSWMQVSLCFQHLTQSLKPHGLFLVYGPFNYNGCYTSESNERFDQFLKASNSQQGIRDFEKIVKLGIENDLHMIADHGMPANNRLLVFKYQP